MEWARHAAVRKGQVIVELCASLGFSLVIFSTGKREARGPPRGAPVSVVQTLAQNVRAERERRRLVSLTSVQCIPIKYGK